MTKDFISKTLKDMMNTTTSQLNQWLSLAGYCQRIGMLSDNNIGIDPLHHMFYFDESTEMLLIRKLDGNLIQSNETKTGYMTININNVNYLNKISDGYIIHDDAGAVHSCVSFDKIVGFYFPDNNESILESYLTDIEES